MGLPRGLQTNAGENSPMPTFWEFPPNDVILTCIFFVGSSASRKIGKTSIKGRSGALFHKRSLRHSFRHGPTCVEDDEWNRSVTSIPTDVRMENLPD